MDFQKRKINLMRDDLSQSEENNDYIEHPPKNPNLRKKKDQLTVVK